MTTPFTDAELDRLRQDFAEDRYDEHGAHTMDRLLATIDALKAKPKPWVVVTDSADYGADFSVFGDVTVVDIDWYYLANRDGIAEMADQGTDYVQETLDCVADAPTEVQTHVRALLAPYIKGEDA